VNQVVGKAELLPSVTLQDIFRGDGVRYTELEGEENLAD
jgi:hypothetical protein